MANYATLKAAIADVVKTNGEQEITGANLQTVLLAIVNSIGADYQFAGVATPSTSAGTPDQNVFYIAGEGNYANFGISNYIPYGAVGIFMWNGTWQKYVMDISSLTENVSTWDIGYIREDKTHLYLSGWVYADISVNTEDMSAVWVNVDATGANAYCFLLDGNDDTLLSWNNVVVNQVIDLSNYPTASRLLVCSRDSYAYSVKIYYMMQHYITEGVNDYITTQENAYGTGFWRKSNTLKLMNDGSIVGVSVPNDNTAMAYYIPADRCWWIGAKFNHGSAPATGSSGYDGINAGLVMSNNTQGREFLLAKILSRDSSINRVDMFYNINGFNSVSSIPLEQAAGTDIDVKLCLSGKIMGLYVNDTLLGSANGAIPFGDRVFGGVLMSLDNKASNITFGQRPSRYAHFSIDDVGKMMKNIADNSPSSIFEDTNFAFLKEMHDKYGLTVTLNLFYSINEGGVWDISSFPATYKNELINASYWLKFAFHGGDETIRYNSEANNAAALASYNSFVSEVTRFASTGSIDVIPRLTYFSGNKTLLNSLYATRLFLGCLTADDEREDNCGLNAAEREAVNGGSDYIDFANNLYYVRTHVRFDTQTTEQVISMVQNDIDSRYPVMEYFTHGANGLTTKDKVSIEAMAQMMVANGIRMDFAMNNLPF